MITHLLQWLDPAVMGKTALVIFCVIFVAVVAYAWTRTPRQVHDWSRIPLEDGDVGSALRTSEPANNRPTRVTRT